MSDKYNNGINKDDLDPTFVAFALYRTSCNLTRGAFVQLSYALAGLVRVSEMDPSLGMCYTVLVKAIEEALQAFERQSEEDVSQQVLDAKALEVWIEANAAAIVKGQEQLDNSEAYQKFMGNEENLPEKQGFEDKSFNEAAKLWGLDESKFKKA